MLPQADYTNLADLRANADIIEEKDELTTYLGFCLPGTLNVAEPAFAIMKIVQSGTAKPIVTQFLWANGFCLYNLSWVGRATYNYTFKKF